MHSKPWNKATQRCPILDSGSWKRASRLWRSTATERSVWRSYLSRSSSAMLGMPRKDSWMIWSMELSFSRGLMPLVRGISIGSSCLSSRRRSTTSGTGAKAGISTSLRSGPSTPWARAFWERPWPVSKFLSSVNNWKCKKTKWSSNTNGANGSASGGRTSFINLKIIILFLYQR